MKRFLAPILLLVLLFPTLALGGEATLDDLVLRKIDGLYFKKFTEVPFTGKVTGKEQGSVKDGIGVVAVKNGLDTSSPLTPTTTLPFYKVTFVPQRCLH
jgi:hypothetical protein